MTRGWTGLSVVLILIPLVARVGDAPGPPAGDVRDFGLVSETEGWVVSGTGLYRTESGGRSWQAISPVDWAGSTILAVSFLDAREGWAVTNPSEIAGPGHYTLSHTLDGGATWESTPLHLFPPESQIAPASAVFLDFVNSSTGWLVIKHVSGSNFSVGSLFRTSDGGSTWTQLSMPIGEPVYFLTENVGWTAGGAAGNELYRTADGGETWQAQNVAPGSATPDQRRFYRLPAFRNNREGLLPVLATGEQTRVELYAAHDGGTGWELAATVPVQQDTTSMDGLPFALIPGAHAALVLPDKDRVVMASDRGEIATVFARQGGTGEITRIEMASLSVGWAAQTSGICTRVPATLDRAPASSGQEIDCRSETRLLGTQDGGRTWTTLNIPPISSSAAVSHPKTPVSQREKLGGALSAGQESASRIAVFTGQGFDKCEIPSVAQLGQWIVDSPYRAVNLYIGGVGRACSNLALTSSLVSELSELGWKSIPTWVGLQAPCYPNAKLRMSLDPTIAFAQGVSEANAAADIAADLGLARPDGSGTIIYDDMEYYDTTDAACHEAVKAFISGWSGQLHARGDLAGVYATGSPLSAFASLSDIPDAIWPANWVSGSYDPSATVWDVYRLSNDLWSNHQRIRQYTGGHLETWGSISLNIDCDVIDGIVASIEPQGSAFGVYLPLVVNNDGPR